MTSGVQVAASRESQLRDQDSVVSSVQAQSAKIFVHFWFPAIVLFRSDQKVVGRTTSLLNLTSGPAY